MAVEGQCDPRFVAVREEFERNLSERGEVGASVCVRVNGTTVVDLWGGRADRKSGRLWDRDTLVVVWSATKGAAALCAHVLAARGVLDLDATVGHYWPEFAQQGKEAITVRQILSHQAGLPVFRQLRRPGGLYDWDYTVRQLETETPFWQPGTRLGYHAHTFGHLVGELVRRVSQRPIEQFFREEIAGPLGLDFHLGLPDTEHHRVALIVGPDLPGPGDPPSRFLIAAKADPMSIQALMVKNTGRLASAHDHDTPTAYRAVLPGQGGLANARSLAGMYAPLAQGGVGLVDGDTLARMGAVSAASDLDASLLIGLRFALGFMKSTDNRNGLLGARESLILSESAFGHAGMGGSLGFADPAAKLAFGYAMNKQGRGVLLNERGQRLVDATYRALGCTSDHSGGWR